MTLHITKEPFKGRRIFAALLATAGAFAGGVIILAPSASAAGTAEQVANCVFDAESISVPGSNSKAILVSCCHYYGGVVWVDSAGDYECRLDPAAHPSAPPVRRAGGQLPTDASHV